jgi:hypothetical protein
MGACAHSITALGEGVLQAPLGNFVPMTMIAIAPVKFPSKFISASRRLPW